MVPAIQHVSQSNSQQTAPNAPMAFRCKTVPVLRTEGQSKWQLPGIHGQNTQ